MRSIITSISFLVLWPACDYDRSVGRVQPPPPPGHLVARWVQSIGGPSADQADRVAIAPGGDVIIAGRSHLGINGPTASPGSAFISRRAAVDGSAVWTAAIDGHAESQVLTVVVDPAGNAFVGGRTIDAPPVPGGVPVGDMFLAKYDPSGHVLWRRGFGSSSRAAALTIALDDQGTVFVGGSFSGTIDLGYGPISNADSPGPTPVGYVGDAFLAAFSAEGTLLWGKAFQGPGAQMLTRLVASSDGLTFIGLTWHGRATFDDAVIDAAAAPALAVLHYTTGGDHVWSRALAPQHDHFNMIAGLAIDPLDGLVMVGHETAGSQSIPSIRVLGSQGETLDTSMVPGPMVSSAEIAPNGMIVTAGLLEGTQDFGTGELTGEVFIAAYDRAGIGLGASTFSATYPAQTTGALRFHSVAATNDSIVVAGHMNYVADFGTGPVWDHGATISADGRTSQDGGGNALVVMFDWIPD